jgi:hypothetical protein
MTTGRRLSGSGNDRLTYYVTIFDLLCYGTYFTWDSTLEAPSRPT